MIRTVTAALILALAQLASAQSSAYGQCGGQGWSGATTCVSGYTCKYSNPYYSQCLPGSPSSSSSTVSTSSPSSSSSSSSSSASSTTTPTKTTTTTGTTGPTSTSGCSPATSSSATLLPNQLWQRVDEAPYFHYYVQSLVLNQPGPAVVSSYTTAMQGNIVGGQWEQFTPCGTTLYATVFPPVANDNRMQVYWDTTPATNVTWAFQGDGVTAKIPGYAQQSSGNFYLCTTTAGVGGTSAAPYLFVNLGAFDYGTPTGCADGTVNYYNAATPTP